MRVLITGAGGYIGQQLGKHLAKNSDTTVLGIDINVPEKNLGFDIIKMDIRDENLTQLVAERHITHIVHLASIVSPGLNEELEYDIDVNGTINVINACDINKIRHLTVTSSGAAYGYHADNPEWLQESDPLRGNEAFSYSRHKKQVEKILQQFSEAQNVTKVLTMRPCTVLGCNTNNKITGLFEQKYLLGVGKSDSPFVFIWDQDVVMALAHGVMHHKSGQFNLAGDGKLNIYELAQITQKKVVKIPPWLLRMMLRVGRSLKLTTTGPEQVMFLEFRPVLSNEQLKKTFGYTPQKTSREVFEFFWQNRVKR